MPICCMLRISKFVIRYAVLLTFGGNMHILSRDVLCQAKLSGPGVLHLKMHRSQFFTSAPTFKQMCIFALNENMTRFPLLYMTHCLRMLLEGVLICTSSEEQMGLHNALIQLSEVENLCLW